jgi:hypothetical protein
MRKIKLKFMVVPEELEKRAYVPNGVKIVITDPESIFLLGILGESGRKLVKSGVPFWFEGGLAKRLIDMGVAERV